MANRENGKPDEIPRSDWETTDEEIAALLDGVGEPPLDVEEEFVIGEFRARLRAAKQSAAAAAGGSTSGRGKLRLRSGTTQLRLEGLEDRAPSAFPYSLSPLMASASSAASLALIADGMPDATHQPFPLHATPIGQADSAAPRHALPEWGIGAAAANRRWADTGVVDHCFSSDQPLCGKEFAGTMSCRAIPAWPQEFLAAVRPSPHDSGTPRQETLPLDHAFAEGNAGRFLPEVATVLLLGGLRIEPLRAQPHHRGSTRVTR
jgi:hypothetical protein